jgi:hypothetical protein
MSYIGNTPTTQSFISGTDYFNGTGAQTAFTLSRTVASVNDIQAVVNNVVQVPNDAYTISGTTITFTSAPSAGTSNVYVRYLSTTTQAITPSQNTVSWSTLDSNVQGDLGISFKNRIINSNMVIDQRNAGASVTSSNTAPYTLDRWLSYSSSSSKYTIQQNAGSVTPPIGFTNYLGCTSSSAYTVGSSEVFSINQFIEGFNTADLNWGSANAKTVTLSFWVRSSLTGTFGGAFANSAGNRSYPFTYTISAANTWEYKTITIPGDTTGTWVGATNGIGIAIFLSIGAGATVSGTAGAWAGATYYSATGATSVVGTNGATWYVTGVQLEVGTQATTFTTAGGSYGAELALCQRYFQFLGGDTPYQTINTVVWYSSTEAVGFFRYPVQMRTAPTIAKTGDWATLNGGTGSASQTISTDQNGPKTVQLGFSGGSGGTGGYAATLRVNNDNNFRLTFSAEL